METCSQELCQFVSIRDEAFDGQRRDGYRVIRLARAWLVPVHHYKMILQRFERHRAGREPTRTGTADAQIQQHWIVSALTANGDPLLAPTQSDLLQGGDAAGQDLPVSTEDWGRRGMPLGPEHGTGQAHEQYPQDEDQPQEPPPPGQDACSPASDGPDAQSDGQRAESAPHNNDNG